MNKAQLIEIVAARLDFTKKDTAAVVDTAIDEIIASLNRLESVKISGLGNFNVKKVKAKQAKNPFNKSEVITIPACKKISFKVSESLKEKMKDK